MTFDLDKLAHLVDEGYLRSQQHPEADLWIYNYSEKTQYENHWTPETLACRGLILDSAGTIVARPFPKFFNWGTPEVGEIPTGERFTVTEKIDGSLGILYELDGENFIATRGSFTSDQAREGTAMLRDQEIETWPGDETPLFEIVYPENRIVVDYGGRRELILLGCIENATGLDEGLPDYSGPVVERHNCPDLETLLHIERPNREGYVVSFESGLRVKIKHDEYVRLHRIITGTNARHIWDAIAAGQDPANELEGVPDEIFAWIDATAAQLTDDFDAEYTTAERIFRDRPATEDRREIAEYFKRSGGNTGVLFRMLDGKPYDDLIWKAIKPEPTTPDTIWTDKTIGVGAEGGNERKERFLEPSAVESSPDSGGRTEVAS